MKQGLNPMVFRLLLSLSIRGPPGTRKPTFMTIFGSFRRGVFEPVNHCLYSLRFHWFEKFLPVLRVITVKLSCLGIRLVPGKEFSGHASTRVLMETVMI